MKKYRHLFFDLDGTLWDFPSNSRTVLKTIFERYNLQRVFKDFSDFFGAYHQQNNHLWDLYRAGMITKKELKNRRFKETLASRDCTDTVLAEKIGNDYVKDSPNQKGIFEGAHEILTYLKPLYHLHLITNGFEEVQYHKLRNCGLDKYFEVVVLSEIAGAMKPKPGIFQYALEKAQAQKSESLMIGDNPLADIEGAQNFGIDQVFFNPDKKTHELHPTYEISELLELKNIL